MRHMRRNPWWLSGPPREIGLKCEEKPGEKKRHSQGRELGGRGGCGPQQDSHLKNNQRSRAFPPKIPIRHNRLLPSIGGKDDDLPKTAADHIIYHQREKREKRHAT